VKKPNGQPIGEPFVPIVLSIFDSEAYDRMTPLAKCILNRMIRHADRDTGRITIGCRYVGDWFRVAKSTASRALSEIEQSGLATIIQRGTYISARLGREKIPTTWRLEFAPFNNGKNDHDQ
jgi:hypothetical protein